MTAPLDLDAIREWVSHCSRCEPPVLNLLAEVERLRAENERMMNANLVRAVMRYVEGKDFDEWVNEAINAKNFDRVPWLAAQKASEKAEALRAESGNSSRTGHRNRRQDQE